MQRSIRGGGEEPSRRHRVGSLHACRPTCFFLHTALPRLAPPPAGCAVLLVLAAHTHHAGACVLKLVNLYLIKWQAEPGRSYKQPKRRLLASGCDCATHAAGQRPPQMFSPLPQLAPGPTSTWLQRERAHRSASPPRRSSARASSSRSDRDARHSRCCSAWQAAAMCRKRRWRSAASLRRPQDACCAAHKAAYASPSGIRPCRFSASIQLDEQKSSRADGSSELGCRD